MTNLQTMIGIICYQHKSSTNPLKLENGESSTRPPIKGSFEQYMIAVTAPIDQPQRPIVDIQSDSQRYSTTVSKSSCSNHPKDT